MTDSLRARRLARTPSFFLAQRFIEDIAKIMKRTSPNHENEARGAVPVIEDIPNFVRTHTDWMLAVAFRILMDQGHAEDVVQQAFIKVFSKIESFEGRSELKTWMHRLVVNEAIATLRKFKKSNEEPLGDLLPVFDRSGCRIVFGPDGDETAETRLIRSQTNTQVRSAIMALPDEYRIVLCLRDIEGLTTQETGAALDISEANVKVRLHRARAALKRMLETAEQEETI